MIEKPKPLYVVLIVNLPPAVLLFLSRLSFETVFLKWYADGDSPGAVPIWKCNDVRIDRIVFLESTTESCQIMWKTIPSVWNCFQEVTDCIRNRGLEHRTPAYYRENADRPQLEGGAIIVLTGFGIQSSVICVSSVDLFPNKFFGCRSFWQKGFDSIALQGFVPAFGTSEFFSIRKVVVVIEFVFHSLRVQITEKLMARK